MPLRLQWRHVPADHAEQHRARPGVLALRFDRLGEAFVVEPAPHVAAAHAVCCEFCSSHRGSFLPISGCIFECIFLWVLVSILALHAVLVSVLVLIIVHVISYWRFTALGGHSW